MLRHNFGWHGAFISRRVLSVLSLGKGYLCFGALLVHLGWARSCRTGVAAGLAIVRRLSK
jgi:hypothetical protein